MRLHLFAHNNENFVKVGDTVEAYKTKIATIGTANGNYWAHLHHSISEWLTEDEVLRYINGWSEDNIKEVYEDPKLTVDYDKMFGRSVDVGNRGYGWLQSISDYSKHPGEDINGHDGGNTDIGYEFMSPVNGIVTKVSETNDQDGWGKLIFIKETMSEKEYHITSDLEKELQKRDKDFDGDKKEDQKAMAEILRDERHEVEALKAQEVVCEFGDYLIIKK